MSLLDSVRKFENLHIVLWLLKDVCWVTDFKVGGMVIIAPTLGLALYLTWQFRANRTEMLNNAAVCAWICANSIWMTGEFFFDDTLRSYAVICFVVGFLFIGTEVVLRIIKPSVKASSDDEVIKDEVTK